MTSFTLDEISRLLDQKYRRGEAMFRDGDMRGAVYDLYAEDAYYLTPQLMVLKGRHAILEFFEALKSTIGEVTVEPLCHWGDTHGTIYQFCNTVRRAPDGGPVTHAHFVAAFRQVGEDWLCEMEVVAAGRIDIATASKCLKSIRPGVLNRPEFTSAGVREKPDYQEK